MPTTTLTLVDGVRIVVPESLDLITPYVLLEQQDWFEDEIKFVRRLLEPGQNVIDIGASYGVYTLSMAHAVGPTGRVWAFEPASSTAKLLAEGVSANGFGHIVLERSALSSACGTAQLSRAASPELNALLHGKPSTRASETVSLATLDECLKKRCWRDIAFVKIDAEGEEANILEGGERFFSELSPLVQYEIKAGTSWHMELVQDFAALCYDSYRLVPGLDLLVPFDSESPPDDYLLNLFCCKRDCAERLAARGLLTDSATHLLGAEMEQFKDIAEKVKNRNAYDWRHTIANLPYGARLANRWEQTVAAGNSVEVGEALACYALSRDSSLSAAERFAALAAGFNVLKTLCEAQPSYLRLASVARIAQDYGARSLAVDALQRLGDDILQHDRVDASEPFLAPGKRFDSIAPGESMRDWVLAAVLEEYERLGSFSSFYTGVSARRNLEIISTLGFGSPEMERRLLLLRKRFGPTGS